MFISAQMEARSHSVALLLSTKSASHLLLCLSLRARPAVGVFARYMMQSEKVKLLL